MSCFVPRSFYHPVAVLQSATKGRVGTPTLIYNFARGHLWGRRGFFGGLGRTNPCPGQGPVAKGWRFFPCLTVLWQLSEWIGDLVIESSWPICDLRHFWLFRRHHRELLCGHDRQKDEDKTLIYSTLMMMLRNIFSLDGRSRKLLLKSGCVWKFEYHIKSESTSWHNNFATVFLSHLFLS